MSGAAASVTQAEAQVSQKQAAVKVAQTNLDYTVIRSPIDGTVVARNVDVGQTVAASLQAPTIFTIAQDLSKMRVYAKTDESDVGNIQAGKPVTFKVDAFPKDTFHGMVEPSAHERDHGAERGHLRHDHRVRESGTEALSRHDGLRHDPGRDGRKRTEAAQHSAALQAADGLLEEVRATYKKYGIEGRPTPSPEQGAGRCRRTVPNGKGGSGRSRGAPAAKRASSGSSSQDNMLEPGQSLARSHRPFLYGGRLAVLQG